MHDPDEQRQHGEQQGRVVVAHDPENERGRGARDERGKRRVARERCDREPDQAERDRRRPGERDQDADIGRHALATLEAEPDWKEMAEECAERRGDRELVAEISILGAIVSVDEQHGDGAFERVSDERRGREPFVSGAQHVGRANITGADRADVLCARELREDETERDRAAEIAEREGDGISGQQRRVDG